MQGNSLWLPSKQGCRVIVQLARHCVPGDPSESLRYVNQLTMTLLAASKKDSDLAMSGGTSGIVRVAGSHTIC